MAHNGVIFTIATMYNTYCTVQLSTEKKEKEWLHQ